MGTDTYMHDSGSRYLARDVEPTTHSMSSTGM